MSYISINEQQFLQSAAPAATALDSEEKKKKKKLYEDLEQIKPDIKTQTDYEQSDYTPPSDDELKQLATESADQKINQKINDYLNKYAVKETKNQTSLNKLQEKSQKEMEKVKENAQNKVVAAKNSALKQGIARSSILDEMVKGYENSLQSQTSSIQNTLGETVAELEKQIKLLDDEKNAALSNFEIEKGLEYQKQVEKLTKERDSKVKEIEKNNAQAQKQYQAAENEFLQDLKSPELKERAAIVMQYYKQLPPQDALDDFAADEQLVKYLGIYHDLVHSLLIQRTRK